MLRHRAVLSAESTPLQYVQGEHRPRRRSPAWILFLIIGAVVAPVIFKTQADPDLWGHVRFGLDLLSAHTLTRVDSYSFTQDLPWINHEWLSELLMGGSYRLGGVIGLAALKGILVSLIFGVVLSTYVEATPGVIAAAFLVLASGSGRVTSSLRPQLWSLLLTAILCRLLLDAPRRWWLVALPLMFALWVNFHGGWIVGAGILAIWAIAHFWNEPASRRLVLAVCVLSALSTLVNPYGWRMWLFLDDTVRMSRPIAEWQPLYTTPVAAWIPWIAVAIGVGYTYFAKHRPPLNRLATVALLAIASFRVERLSPFFVVAALILLSPVAVAEWPSGMIAVKAMPRRAAMALAVACALALIVSATITSSAASCIPLSGDWIPDRRAGQTLAEAHVSGRLVTWFDWGEYAIWHLSPAIRVSLDGRRETLYSDAVLRSHDELDEGTPEGIAYMKTLNPDYVWLPSSLMKLQNWLVVNGYRIDIRTDRSFVAVRSDHPVLALSSAPLAACFPGP